MPVNTARAQTVQGNNIVSCFHSNPIRSFVKNKLISHKIETSVRLIYMQSTDLNLVIY